MTDIAKLGIQIEASDIKRAVKELKRLEKQSGKVEQSASGMGSAFKRLGPAMAAIASSVVISKIIQTASAFESMKKSLVTVTGSAEQATLAFDGIRKFAKDTPFSVAEITDSFIKLKALGLQPTESALTSFGNTSAAMGRSLNQMIEAVADAATGEFERLKEFGIKARSQGEDVAFTFQGVTTTVGKNAQEITAFLESIGQTNFAGAMNEQMDTVKGATSLAGDAIDNLADSLGEAGLNTIVKEVTLSFAGLANSIANFINPDAKTQIEEITEQLTVLKERMESRSRRGLDVGEEIRAMQELGEEYRKLTEKVKESEGGLDKASRSEVAAQDMSNMAELMATANAFEIVQLEEQEQAKLDTKMAAQHQERMALALFQLDKEAAEANHQRAMKNIIMGSLGNLSVLMSSQSKKLFKLGKAASLATAVIKGYESVVSSYAAGAKIGGPVLGAAFATTAALATAVQIQNIRAQSFGGGGSAPSSVGGGASTSATLGAGREPLFPAPAADQQGGGQVTINIMGGMVTPELIDEQLIPAFQDAIENRDLVLISSESRNGQNFSGDFEA